MAQACNEEIKDTSLLKNQDNPVVKMETTMGDIYIELYQDESPIGVENFLAYANEGYYEGTIFHRVIGNFMIQGGGFESGLAQKETKEPIKNEATNGLSNKRGTVAYARTQIVDSATSQFFINTVDNPFLDYAGNSPQQFGYSVFGNVIQGFEVVDAIKQVETTTVSPYENVPASDVIINRVTVIKK